MVMLIGVCSFSLASYLAIGDGAYCAYKHSKHVRREGFALLYASYGNIKSTVESPSFRMIH